MKMSVLSFVSNNSVFSLPGISMFMPMSKLVLKQMRNFKAKILEFLKTLPRTTSLVLLNNSKKSVHGEKSPKLNKN